MGDKNPPARKPERGILVCPALTVSNQCIKLIDKGTPSLFLKPTGGWRAQSPADHGLMLFVHPFDGRWRRKVTRIGFHDQRVWIPVCEPVNKPALVTEIKRAAEEMDVLSQVVISNF